MNNFDKKYGMVIGEIKMLEDASFNLSRKFEKIQTR